MTTVGLNSGDGARAPFEFKAKISGPLRRKPNKSISKVNLGRHWMFVIDFIFIVLLNDIGCDPNINVHNDTHLPEPRRILVQQIPIEWRVAVETAVKYIKPLDIVSVQNWQNRANASLEILFATFSGSPAEPSTSLCEVATQPLNVCSGPAECHIHDSKIPIIICNQSTIEVFTSLVEVNHDQQALTKLMESNESFSIGMEKRVRAGFQGTVASEHLTDHLTQFFVFILAHEMYHVEHPKAIGDTPAAGPSQPNMSQRISEAISCRVDVAIHESGWSWFGPDKMLSVVKNDPDIKPYLEETLKTWQDEIAADRFAVDTIIEHFSKAIKEGHKEAVVKALEEFIKDLGMFSVYAYWKQTRNFMSAFCQDQTSYRFAVSRCFCSKKEALDAYYRIFDETHPPFFVRYYVILAHLFGHNQARLAAIPGAPEWDKIAFAYVDGLGKLALWSCNRSSFEKSVAKDGVVVFMISALEGMHTVQADGWVGYSPDDEAEVHRYCIDVANKRFLH